MNDQTKSCLVGLLILIAISLSINVPTSRPAIVAIGMVMFGWYVGKAIGDYGDHK